MTFGLKTINTSNTVQIDSDYLNMHLAANATVTSLSAAAYHSTYQVSGGISYQSTNSQQVYWFIRIHGTRPFMVIRPPTGVQVATSFVSNPLNKAPMAIIGDTSKPFKNVFLAAQTTTITNLDIFVFDDIPSTVDTSQFGIAVYDETSQVVFSSTGAKPLKLVTNTTLSGSVVGVTSITVNGSKSYGFGWSFTGGRYHQSYPYAKVPCLYRFDSTTVKVGAISNDIANITTGAIWDVYTDFGFVVDLTGM